MICLRCQGRLMPERLARGGAWWWRCYNCGERTDGVILRHRAEEALAREVRAQDQQRDLREWALWFQRLPGSMPTS